MPERIRKDARRAGSGTASTQKKGGTMKQFLTAADVAEITGASLSKAYKLISQLNAELEKQNYITLRGKVPAAYFDARMYGGIRTGAGV